MRIGLKKLGFLATIMIMMGVLNSCASKKDSVEAKQAMLYFGAGTQSLMDQNYTEALTNLLKANELEPKNPDILNNLGMAYYFKGETELAIKYINQSLELNEQNSDARLNLASIYYQSGDIKRAEKLYLEVTKDLTYDKQARTYYNLGVLEEEKRKNLNGAEEYFKKALKEDINYCPAFLQLGLLRYKRKQFNTALKNFKDASSGSCYESPVAHYYYGMTLVDLRRFEDARIKFDEIDTHFKKSVFAVKARAKAVELNEIEARYKAPEAHASLKVLESPDF